MRFAWAAALLVSTFCGGTSMAFDTAWHVQATRSAAKLCGFDRGASNVLVFGNFGPDYLGPLYDKTTAFHLTWAGKAFFRELATIQEPPDRQGGRSSSRPRNAAIFMHFDDLHDVLNSNDRFAWLFSTLLANTKASLRALKNIEPVERRRLALITLGASLHMVQDFYSHTNWTHRADSDASPPTMVPGRRFINAPLFVSSRRKLTWFEALDRHGGFHEDDLGFHVFSGTYPDPREPTRTDEGIPKTHSEMNHDNSALTSDTIASKCHRGRRGEEDLSAAAHQQIAVQTAIAASVEWIHKVEADPVAKAVLDDARASTESFDSEIRGIVWLSCAVKHWDGDGGNITNRICGHPDLPTTLLVGSGAFPKLSPGPPSFRRELWSLLVSNNVLENLVFDLGNERTDSYRFVPDSVPEATANNSVVKPEVVPVTPRLGIPVSTQIGTMTGTKIGTKGGTGIIFTRLPSGKLEVSVPQQSVDRSTSSLMIHPVPPKPDSANAVTKVRAPILERPYKTPN